MSRTLARRNLIAHAAVKGNKAGGVVLKRRQVGERGREIRSVFQLDIAAPSDLYPIDADLSTRDSSGGWFPLRTA